MTFNPTESLQAAMLRMDGPVPMLRNSPARIGSQGAMSGQFSNWQSEAHAWRDACAFLDQSHHMVDLYITGPDAFRMLNHLGVNSFKGFGPDMAKQFVCVGPSGHFIGDAILFCLAENSFNLVGRRTGLDWVEYQAGTGGWDVEIRRCAQTQDRAGKPPVQYRYEVQGPLAAPLMEALTGAPLPDVKFFGMCRFDIAGREVRALRHGMAGAIGFELFGPWQDADAVRDAVLAAGEPFGMQRVGALAYSTANLESGWVPGPVPAIFDGEDLRAYREWLPAARAGALAGSLDSRDIRDYYVTPQDLGYGKIVKFDHDFLGMDALKALMETPQRQKVTLVWNPEDVTRVMASHWLPGPKYKTLNIPKGRYGLYQMDQIVEGGVSLDCGLLANQQAMVSLAILPLALAEPGREVTLLWGESPNTAKPGVEPHEQTEIRATVSPCPFGAHARTDYRH